MKRVSKILAILCVLCGIFALFACEPIEEKRDITINVKVVAEGVDEEYTISGSFATFEDVMVLLSTKDEGFSYVAASSEYGLFITEVCGYAVSGNEYWGLYTDTISTDNKGLVNVFEEYTVSVEGKTYYSCASGASGQAVYNGETILLIVGTF